MNIGEKIIDHINENWLVEVNRYQELQWHDNAAEKIEAIVKEDLEASYMSGKEYERQRIKTLLGL
jgi:hypothetical protein